MSRWSPAEVGLLMAGVVVILGSDNVLGQSATPTQTPAAQTSRVVRKSAWTPTRMPDGSPDLQGVWNNSTLTPLERRADRMGGAATITEQDAEAVERQNAERIAREASPSPLNREPPPAGVPRIFGYNDYWMDMGTKVAIVNGERRTSLIVDPPDGRIPYTPEARAAQARMAGRREIGPWLHYGDLDTGDRCLTDGIPWTPYGYNNNFQIVQAPGHFVIQREQNNEVRIITTDGRPHLGPEQARWMGDSRGRWEGDTLVVETINFLDRNHYWWVDTWRAARPTLRVIERFTRVDKDQINYEFTVEDPTTFTRPWTAVVPMVRTDERMFEYACHEGNYAASNILRGVRAQEAEAAKKGSK